MKSRDLVWAALAGAAVACTTYDHQSVLDPVGPQATSTRQLFYFMMAVAVIVYVIVVGALLVIIRNRRTAVDDPQSPAREARAERTIKIAIAIVVPVMYAEVARNAMRSPTSSGRPRRPSGTSRL